MINDTLGKMPDIKLCYFDLQSLIVLPEIGSLFETDYSFCAEGILC